MARSTRLLGATTRRFRLILSGREACRANGCPGGVQALPRSARTPSPRTCCSNVTRHHSKKSANLRVRSAPDVLSFDSSNSNARPDFCSFRGSKNITDLVLPEWEGLVLPLPHNQFICMCCTFKDEALCRRTLYIMPYNAKVCAQEPSRPT